MSQPDNNKLQVNSLSCELCICSRKRWLQTVSLSRKKIAIIQKDETTAR